MLYGQLSANERNFCLPIVSYNGDPKTGLATKEPGRKHTAFVAGGDFKENTVFLVNQREDVVSVDADLLLTAMRTNEKNTGSSYVLTDKSLRLEFSTPENEYMQGRKKKHQNIDKNRYRDLKKHKADMQEVMEIKTKKDLKPLYFITPNEAQFSRWAPK